MTQDYMKGGCYRNELLTLSNFAKTLNVMKKQIHLAIWRSQIRKQENNSNRDSCHNK